MTGSRPLAATYVLPLRWDTQHPGGRDVTELATYLRALSALLDVIVVDGSSPPAFAIHRDAWADVVRHVPPAAASGRNGKVAGVVTGVLLARHECVVVADDDVRHDRGTLTDLVAALAGADLARPQNHFVPADGGRLPWHARWDTARSLVNRAMGHDHPGTFGLRRSTFLAMGGYDGDVMFENLELARTVRASGGRERHLPGSFVPRLPPTTRRFWSQRVRQAYDDLAQPARLVTELAVLPAVVLLARRAPRALAAAMAGVLLLAEAGRRRAGGRRVYAADTALWALPWLAERSVCVWVALGQRALGGVPYRGERVPRAASAMAYLRSHPRPALTAPTGPADRTAGPSRATVPTPPIRDLRPVRAVEPHATLSA